MSQTRTAAKRALPLLSFLAVLLSASSPAGAGPGVLTPVGPGDGSLQSVEVHPGSPGKVWIGFPAGGVDRSDNRGGSWVWAGRPLAGEGVAALAADPSRPGALWAAKGAAVFHTENGGKTWRRISDGGFTAALGESSPRALAEVGGALFVLSSRRLLATRDGGSTWEVLFEAAAGGSLHAFGGGSGGLFLATFGVSGYELLRSADGGGTWASVPGDWWRGNRISQIEVTPVGVYVRLDEGVESTLLRSVDGGATWHPVLGGDPAQRFVVNALAVDARQPRTLWAIGGAWRPDPAGAFENRLWVSRNGGTTWRRRGLAPAGSRLTVEPGSEVLYVSSSQGLARTLDGGRTWQSVLRNLDRERPPSQVAFQPGNPARMAMVVGNRLALSENGGLSWWMPSPETWVTDVDFDPADPARMLGTADIWSIWSRDGGRTWNLAPSPDFPNHVDQLVRTGRRTVFAGGCGILRSTDNGRTWGVSLPCGSRFTPSNSLRYLRKLVADPADPQTLYALTAQVQDFYYTNYDTLHPFPSILWKSEDGGASWRKIGQNLKAVAVSPLGGRVFAVRGLDLLVSDDGARTWRTFSRLPRAAYDLVLPAGNPNAFFALFETGVLYTGNGGVWTEYRSIPLPGYSAAAVLSALVPHPTDPRTVFVTSHATVFHLRVP